LVPPPEIAVIEIKNSLISYTVIRVDEFFASYHGNKINSN
jgi:hypothetical protein